MAVGLIVAGAVIVLAGFLFAGVTVALGVNDVSTAETIRHEYNLKRIKLGRSVLVLGLWVGGGLTLIGLFVTLVKLVSPYVQ